MTYENCREIMRNLLYALNEYSDARLDGTDTSGRFNLGYLLQHINSAQDYIYNLVLRRKPKLFLAESSLTGVNSVFTLPSDLGRLRLFVDEKGDKIFPVDVDNLKRTDTVGSKQIYYRKGNTLVLDQDGVTDTYKVYYYRKPVKLNMGTASAGAAGSITLQATIPLRASKLVDYYNNQLIENETQDWVDTITDYSTTRVATITETAVASDKYGTVSNLPEVFHALIMPRALMQINSEHPVNTKQVITAQKTLFDENLSEALKNYASHTDDDVDSEDIFADFHPPIPSYGGYIATE